MTRSSLRPRISPRPGTPKRRILVAHFEVARIERGFGNAPGNAAFVAVVDLALNDEAARFAEQTFGGRAHHQRGMTYSNIEPDQEMSAAPLPTGVKVRPRRNQCEDSASPLAMATRLARRASEASRS